MTQKYKLIKLSEQDYIVVDDSEIKEGDKFYSYILDEDDKPVYGIYTCLKNYKSKFDNHITSIETGRNEDDTRHFIFYTDTCKKITHSTQPLECDELWVSLKGKQWMCNTMKCCGAILNLKTKPLSLSEAQEIEFGYSVEKMAVISFCGLSSHSSVHKKGYIEGFNAHKELVKDNRFTVEDMRKMYDMSCGQIGLDLSSEQTENNNRFNSFIQLLLPPTEWKVTFDEQGKLKLVE